MGQRQILKISSKPILGILFVIRLLLALNWSMHSLPSWMPSIPIIPVALLQLSYRFITAVIAIVVLMNVAPILLTSKGYINYKISQLGYYSLGIYVTHYLIIWFIADWICKKGQMGNTVAEVLIVFILGLLSSVILVWLLNKSHFTSNVLLGKVDRK